MIHAQALGSWGKGRSSLIDIFAFNPYPSTILTVTGECMSTKVVSHSRIKTIKLVCDRCKEAIEGIRGEEFTGGFYDMSKWEEYRRENEYYICHSCMFGDPRYVERYGSSF